MDLGGEGRMPVILQVSGTNAKKFVNLVNRAVEQHVIIGHVEMTVVVDPLRLDPHQ